MATFANLPTGTGDQLGARPRAQVTVLVRDGSPPQAGNDAAFTRRQNEAAAKAVTEGYAGWRFRDGCRRMSPAGRACHFLA